MVPTRNSAGQIVGEVEIPADVVNGESRAAAVPMVVDRNAWKGARLTGPEEEKARAEMRRASLQLWRNANGGYVVPGKVGPCFLLPPTLVGFYESPFSL